MEKRDESRRSQALDVHLRVLRRQVGESGRTLEGIRKRAGRRGAFLVDVLCELRPLKLDELFAFLKAIDVPPGKYFAEVCRELEKEPGA